MIYFRKELAHFWPKLLVDFLHVQYIDVFPYCRHRKMCTIKQLLLNTAPPQYSLYCTGPFSYKQSLTIQNHVFLYRWFYCKKKPCLTFWVLNIGLIESSFLPVPSFRIKQWAAVSKTHLKEKKIIFIFLRGDGNFVKHNRPMDFCHRTT